MSVITISRGSFSGGKMLAESLAEELNYRTIDRDTIVEKAAACGASPHDLRNALERAPSFLERFRHKRYVYLAVIQAALAEEVRHGDVVYHGHAGHLLLKGATPVFRVRVIAPLEVRISMAKQRLGLNREESISYIRKVDQERKKWAEYLYGIDWADASLYDLVINLEHLDLENAPEIIIRTAKTQKCFLFDSRCQEAMDDLARASRVKADLALNSPTADLELEVEAEGGEVRIGGKVSSIDQIGEIERVARLVEGVAEVNLEQIAPAVTA